MSTDIINNQAQSVASNASSATASSGKPTVVRQDVAVQDGSSLPPEEVVSKVEVSPQELQDAVSKLNEHVQQINRDLHFSVDDTSGRTVIRVINTETEETVRQIPSEEVLRISQNLHEQLEQDNVAGLLFETSA